ncbi:hypothetical protein AS156_36230 [Bradyrhizobium macuxiense]|uniref:Uncharacterized protein n=1 Tax=Bradyrhizobium macuxiense TaxID=1755647 RepID=A0A109K074_9BRAD|nr:hypothetical protein AS156_36230 [Bradyrhizobium macuxiense]
MWPSEVRQTIVFPLAIQRPNSSGAGSEEKCMSKSDTSKKIGPGAFCLKLAKEFAAGSPRLGLEPFAQLWCSLDERIRASSLTLWLRNWPVGRADRSVFPRDSQARQKLLDRWHRSWMACWGGVAETGQLLLHGSDIAQ